MQNDNKYLMENFIKARLMEIEKPIKMNFSKIDQDIKEAVDHGILGECVNEIDPNSIKGTLAGFGNLLHIIADALCQSNQMSSKRKSKNV
jgi:hypothetical protein